MKDSAFTMLVTRHGAGSIGLVAREVDTPERLALLLQTLEESWSDEGRGSLLVGVEAWPVVTVAQGVGNDAVARVLSMCDALAIEMYLEWELSKPELVDVCVARLSVIDPGNRFWSKAARTRSFWENFADRREMKDAILWRAPGVAGKCLEAHVGKGVVEAALLATGYDLLRAKALLGEMSDRSLLEVCEVCRGLAMADE